MKNNQFYCVLPDADAMSLLVLLSSTLLLLLFLFGCSFGRRGRLNHMERQKQEAIGGRSSHCSVQSTNELSPVRLQVATAHTQCELPIVCVCVVDALELFFACHVRENLCLSLSDGNRPNFAHGTESLTEPGWLADWLAIRHSVRSHVRRAARIERSNGNGHKRAQANWLRIGLP